mgnify:FL=1
MASQVTASVPQQTRGNLWGLALAVVIVMVLTGLLHARAGIGTTSPTLSPLPVSTAGFAVVDGYQRDVSFLGLIRAGQRSNIGFEVPGLVMSVPVREGSTVQAGQEIARLDTAQLQSRRDAVSADLERVTAELELARLKAERQRDLRDTGAVSREAYDETRLRAKALEAQLKSAAAQLQGIDLDLAKSSLYAPYDGVVAQRMVNEGAVVSIGTPVARIVASGLREAHIGIAVEQAARLTPGQRYSLMLRDETIEATLRSVRPDIDPATLTTTAVFELPSGVNGLDGEPVALTLSETVAVPGAWLPITALIEGERGLWTVLRLGEQDGSTVALREAVEVLHIDDDRAYVRGTLVEGQRVVADGIHRVTPGTPVVDVREEN